MADGEKEIESQAKKQQERLETTTERDQSAEGPETITSESGARNRMTSESSLSEDAKYEELQETCREAFNKIALYLNGELTASLDDYTLLEKLNNMTTSKYQEMSSMAKTLITSMEELDTKYKSLQPYLDQIDSVEESVASLEQAAYRLDAYSKKLEARFKRLERR